MDGWHVEEYHGKKIWIQTESTPVAKQQPQEPQQRRQPDASALVAAIRRADAQRTQQNLQQDYKNRLASMDTARPNHAHPEEPKSKEQVDVEIAREAARRERNRHILR